MNLFVSAMRTLVPLAVGLVLAVTGWLGLDVTGESATAAVTAVVAAVYYLVFRVLEAWAGRLGWEPLRMLAGVLLGWARPPEYDGAQLEIVPVRLRLDAAGLDRDLTAALDRARRKNGWPCG